MVLVKDNRERKRDPEGRREQCDKTWLSLADGNYLHDNAGNHSGSMDKAEDKGLKTFFGLQKGRGVKERFKFVISLYPRLDKHRQGER